MIKPSHPKNEASRVRALKSLGILDTPPEERFDRLTRIANRLFGVPIALVSIVDENRQWFKSSFGLAVKETHRDISFCGHAILGDEIFIVNDTSKDDRFVDNPLVLNYPNIRFYAGCPLNSQDGSKLGTICIIDNIPRKLSAEDRVILKDLAALVQREIELTELAQVDELTKILNRRGFMTFADKEFKLCQRKNLPITLVFFDLNKFKDINDSYGHAEGDKVLINFSENIRSVLRDSDVLGRVGGDEFVVLFPDTSKETVEPIIHRLKSTLDEFTVRESANHEISFSYGIVEFDLEIHKSLENLLNESDKLMYKQKHSVCL